MTVNCAVVGLGTMGSGMTQRLVEQGVAVTTWSRSGRTVPGARPAVDLPGAVRGRDVALLSLSDDTAVSAVVAELLEAGAVHAGQTVVDTSTIAPRTARVCAADLASVGAAYLDAPVSGGPSGARRGELTVVVGGDEGAFARVAPLLASVGSNVVHVGAIGSGQVLKLCLQGAVAVQMNMIAQLLAVATDHGVAPDVLQSALSTSTARNHMAQTRFPVPGVVPDSPASHDWRPDFSGRLMAKDVALVQHLLDGRHRLDGLESAAAALTAQLGDGLGDRDWSRAFA